MFRALRIVPILAVLGAVALVGKAGGIMLSLDESDVQQAGATRSETPERQQIAGLAAFQPIEELEPIPDPAPELAQDPMVPRSIAEAPLALPPSPEALLAPAAGGEAEEEAEGDDAAASDSDSMDTAALEGEDGVAAPSRPVRDPFDMSDEELELLQRLVERREALAERGRMLDERESLLEATEARIADKMNELKNLQAVIEGLLAQYDEEEEARLQSLVKIYESMKPKEAARIFEELDILVLLDVIGRMKERKSAPILAKMNPLKAKTVTLELAQRRSMPFARE